MERKQVTVDATEGCQFAAVIATLNTVDHDGDVVLPGAFGSLDGIPILWAHDSSRIPLGKCNIRESGEQVVAEGELIHAEACGWLRHDFSNPPSRQELSWGFLPTKWRRGELDGRQVRFLEQIDLIECSFVLRGASVGTRLLDVKSADCGCGCGGHGACAEQPTSAEVLAAAGYKRYRREYSPELSALCTAIAGERQPAFIAWEAGPGEKAGTIALPEARGWCLYADSGPIVGVNAEHHRSKASLLFTAAHEVMHSTGERSEDECDRWARDVVAAVVSEEHGEAYYAASQGRSAEWLAEHP